MQSIQKFTCAARNVAAELEREKTSQRTREHLPTKARRGLAVGGKTYGYDNIEIKEGDRRVRVEYKINPQQAAIAREICTRYANGEGLKSIAKDLNMRGIESPRGRGWAQSALLPMISRERYRGILTWGRVSKSYRGGTKVRRDAPSKDWVTVEMPELRIIDNDLWEAMQARLLKKTRYGQPRPRGAPPKYLLVGLSRCATCGGRMAITNGRSSYDAVKVYVCANYREKRTCTNSLQRPVPAVDQAVLAWVEQNILTESVITTVLKEVRRRLSERSSVSGDEAAELQAQAKKLKAEITRFGEAICSTSEPPMALVRIMSEKEKSLSAIEARLAAIQTAPQVLDLEVRRLEKEARRRLSELRGLTERRPEEARKALEALLVGPLTLHRSKPRTALGSRSRVRPLSVVR